VIGTHATAGVEEILARLECVGARPHAVSELPGGLTNRNYRVRTGAGDDYVVRVAGRGSSLLAIDREHEHVNSLAAAAAGVGAPVVEFRPDLGVLVVGYIPARAFTEHDVREGRNLPRIAAACRALHAGPRFGNDFDMFAVQRGYLEIVTARGFRLPPRYLDYLPAMERVRVALAVRPAATVPCNNDLLAGNLLDDGRDIWLIDYEYSGNNDPAFELGNIWSESDLELGQLEELVGHYWGRRTPAALARARLQGLMSKYGWTLWAAIQDSIAEIDFDFWSWGSGKYERARAEFDGPDFPHLLEDVASD
jgi:thiamine kinase-like enzyme